MRRRERKISWDSEIASQNISLLSLSPWVCCYCRSLFFLLLCTLHTKALRSCCLCCTTSLHRYTRGELLHFIFHTFVVTEYTGSILFSALFLQWGSPCNAFVYKISTQTRCTQNCPRSFAAQSSEEFFASCLSSGNFHRAMLHKNNQLRTQQIYIFQWRATCVGGWLTIVEKKSDDRVDNECVKIFGIFSRSMCVDTFGFV